MIRSIALGSLIALAAVLSVPARATDPAGEQAQGAERRHWWNDPVVVEKLSLTGDQRAQMDQMFEAHQSARKRAAAVRTAPSAFHQALEQGDGDRARTELDAWADGERALVQATGNLKIGVLSLLTEQQRKALASAYPRLIRQTWMPRPSWEPQPPQNLQPGKKRPGGRNRPAS